MFGHIFVLHCDSIVADQINILIKIMLYIVLAGHTLASFGGNERGSERNIYAKCGNFKFFHLFVLFGVCLKMLRLPLRSFKQVMQKWFCLEIDIQILVAFFSTFFTALKCSAMHNCLSTQSICEYKNSDIHSSIVVKTRNSWYMPNSRNIWKTETSYLYHQFKWLCSALRALTLTRFLLALLISMHVESHQTACMLRHTEDKIDVKKAEINAREKLRLLMMTSNICKFCEILIRKKGWKNGGCDAMRCNEFIIYSNDYGFFFHTHSSSLCRMCSFKTRKKTRCVTS